MTPSPRTIPAWRDGLGRALMGLAAVGAVFAAGGGLGALAHASPQTSWLEAWRALGFVMFAGMFALLALRPRRSPGLWELAFFHKAALAVTALFVRSAEARAAGPTDGVLALLLLAAYLLTAGWRGWRRKHS